MRYWDDGHMDNGWGIVMLLGMVGIWALVTVAIVWIVRSSRSSEPTAVPPGPGALGPASGGATGSAEQILAERLARGDIDVDEYRSRVEALTSRGTR